MPIRSVIDSLTGNNVEAIQAGHGGTLMLGAKGLDRKFEEGDWIVTFSPDHKEVFKDKVFTERFSLGKPKTKLVFGES